MNYFCYHVLGKVLVTTGYNFRKGNYGTKTEILDLKNPHLRHVSRIEDLPAVRYDSVGSVIKGHPVICGGRQLGEIFQDYFILDEKPLVMRSLPQQRSYASSVVLEEKLWMTGGEDRTPKWSDVIKKYSCHLSSTIFISLNDPPLKGPDLPIIAKQHCMIKYDENSVLLTGGVQNRLVSNQTWIMKNPLNGLESMLGPPLSTKRRSHCCGKMILGDKIFIVVAGGSDESHTLDSVELLDPFGGKFWISGPEMPMKLGHSAMITSPDGRGVIVIGGGNEEANDHDGKEYDIIMELRGESIQTLAWTILDQRLEYARSGHLAFSIPDDNSFSFPIPRMGVF